MSTGQAPGQSRLLFADWLRAWALLVMIETHVFNAFLAAGLRRAGWFGALSFVNGLVAPSFLFVSGFVFLVASQKRIEDLRGFGKSFWRQMGKAGMIAAIGYVMHLPSYSPLRLLGGVSPQEWLWFYRADVLHCISVTWIFLMLSLALLRSECWQRIWFLACVLALSVLSPLVWSVEFRPLVPAPIAAYLNVKTGSLFPLFPWSAFMLAGALCASLFLAERRKENERGFMAWLAVVGLALAAAGHFLPPLRFLPRAQDADWWADPRTFLLRLGLVLLLLGACFLYGLRRSPRKSVLLDVSRESLFVYVAHLLIIYGPFWGGKSMADVVGRTQGPLVCLLASVALAAVMLAGARAWSRLKRRPAIPAAHATL
ncbi:MAG: heparan-alpha-glucosaminide N-acetyltransferase domain-containing protein [Bryobacteraceae bacterium]